MPISENQQKKKKLDRGINCRYLGLVRHHIPQEFFEFKSIILIEILARVLKNNLKLKLRTKMRNLKQPLEEPYRILGLFFLQQKVSQKK